MNTARTNPDIQPANFGQWFKKDFWPLGPAVELSVGVEPYGDLTKAFSGRHGPVTREAVSARTYFQLYQQRRRRYLVARAATEAAALGAPPRDADGEPSVEPWQFIRWAQGGGYELPPALIHLGVGGQREAIFSPAADLADDSPKVRLQAAAAAAWRRNPCLTQAAVMRLDEVVALQRASRTTESPR